MARNSLPMTYSLSDGARLSKTTSQGRPGSIVGSHITSLAMPSSSFGRVNSMNRRSSVMSVGSAPGATLQMPEYDSMSIEDLVSEAGPEYIKSNLKSYNQRLIAYLTQQGLNVNPLKLHQTKLQSPSKGGLLKLGTKFSRRGPNIDIFLTSNGLILFLPFNPYRRKRHRHGAEDSTGQQGSSDGTLYPEDFAHDEDEEGDGGVNSDEEQAAAGGGAGNDVFSPLSPVSTATTTVEERAMGRHRHNVTSHTFCVIVKLAKEETLNPIVRADYHADAKTRWMQGIPAKEGSKRHLRFKERYRVSRPLVWNLDLRNPDCYIPFKDKDYDDGDDFSFDLNSGVDSDSTATAKDIVFAEQPTQEVRFFQLLDAEEFKDEMDVDGKEKLPPPSLYEGEDLHEAKTFQPGYYVFMLPVAYPINTPETVLTPLGGIAHRFDVQMEKQPFQPAILAPPTSLAAPPRRHSMVYNDEDDEDEGSDLRSVQPAASQATETSDSSQKSSSNKLSFFKKFTFRKSAHKSKSGTSRSSSGLKARSATGDSKSSLLGFEYNLPVVRLPPSDATSTLNKSIYVNKVWNNSLNYELLLPRKYIQLSPTYTVNDQFLKQNSFMLQMKLIPLVKGLCLKRIKINVVEKATYISQDQKYEQDVGMTDHTGVKERVVTLLEIKARDKPSHGDYPPLCSQVVKGCTNDNLLTCCYKSTVFDQPANTGKGKGQPISYKDNDDVIITNPVKIQCPLTFAANDESNFIDTVHKNLTKGASDLAELRDSNENLDDSNDLLSIFSVNTGGNNNNASNANAAAPPPVTAEVDSAVDPNEVQPWVSKSPALSPILSAPRTLKTFYGITAGLENSELLSDAEKVRVYSFVPDATFHNIKIRHRLQVCFRISKPDAVLKTADGPTMHHYEVIVDTPVVFVSPFCVSEALDLPSYDYAVKSSGFDSAAPAQQGFSFTQAAEGSDEPLPWEPQLPTFDEAVLQPGSPMMTGFSSTNFSAASAVDSTTVLSQSPFSQLSLSPLDTNVGSPAAAPPQSPTLQDDVFAKRSIRRASIKNSQLSSGSPRRSSEDRLRFGSIDGALSPPLLTVTKLSPPQSPAVYDESQLPSYQSVIEQDRQQSAEHENTDPGSL